VETIGIRELKNHLSRHLKRVQAGARLVVTERGRQIATIAPIETDDMAWLHKMIAEGRASWGGGKPKGSRRPVRLKGSPMSDSVIEDRR
jgi:prevent-host-death family protein